MEFTLQQQIDDRLKAISDNEEKIMKANADNTWHRKYLKILKQQQEAEKEESVSELLDEVSKGLK